MPVRRSADPISVQHVWDGVRYATASHLPCSLPVLVRYIQKVENCSVNQAELHIKQCLQDGLLISLQKLGTKGSKLGVPIEVYKIPLESFEKPNCNDKDWYCIECHLAGDVTPCQQCHRVFHSECISVAKKKFTDFMNNSKTCDNYNIKATLEHRLSSLNSSGNSSILESMKNVFSEDNNQTLTAVENNENSNDDSSSLMGVSESSDKIEENFVDNLEKLSNSAIENKELKIDGKVDNEIDKSIISPTTSNSENFENLVVDKSGYNQSLCRICNLLNINEDSTMTKNELNHLLTFVFTRIKTWLPVKLTDKMAPATNPEWLNENEVKWRMSQLFYEYIDMSLIEEKLETESYQKICEFLSDVLTIQHNVAIFHGIESQEYGAAELMFEDCNYDLSEVRNCPDCYQHSNEKVHQMWFSLPCRKQHKLVWAKQKGYPYWPAKVIKEANNKFDVRFFGGNHERSLLHKNFIKPITTPWTTLQIKKNASFNKAVEELTLHQKLIENPSYVHTLLKEKKIKTEKKPREPKLLYQSSTSRPHSSQKSKAASDDGSFMSDDLCDNFENNLSRRPEKRKLSRSSSTGSAKSQVKKKPIVAQNQNSSCVSNQKPSTDIINLTSDGDDDASFRDDDQFSLGYGEVSSSTEHIRLTEEGLKEISDGVMQQLDRQYSEEVERTKEKLEKCKDKKQLIKVALNSMQAEIDRINNKHDDYLKKIFEAQNQEISQTKKRQWCYNCEQEAIYHCCWNTAYCSPICQQQHWQAEHKKVCRRKR